MFRQPLQFTAVKKKLIDREAPAENKYAAVDKTLKRLEQKLKNGTTLEQGQRGANKVSAMAAQLTTLNQHPEEKLPAAKSVRFLMREDLSSDCVRVSVFVDSFSVDQRYLLYWRREASKQRSD